MKTIFRVYDEDGELALETPDREEAERLLETFLGVVTRIVKVARED